MTPSAIQHNAFSSTLPDTEMLWEINNARFLSGMRKLDINDYKILEEYLAPLDNDDPYALSPAYYLMTGRKGLWLYQEQEYFLLFCWHPNIKGQILVFLPQQRESSSIWDKFLTQIPEPPAGILAARIQNDHIKGAYAIEEQTLDWVYPVQTLSTQDVILHKGNRFRDLKVNLNRIGKENIDVKSITDTGIFIEALQLINKWSNAHENEEYEIQDLSDPQIFMLKLLRLNPDKLDGFVVYHNGVAAGVSVWEKLPQEIANSFVSVARPEVRSLSEYIGYQVCSQLHSEGIRHVCIGGSENIGLDYFKRKFNPIHSLSLRSFSAPLIKATVAGKAA